MNELQTSDAAVAGEASVIRAGDKLSVAGVGMQLQAGPAVLRATVHVTRAGTGKVDTYEIVGTPEPQKET